jgi:hypothetical protein
MDINSLLSPSDSPAGTPTPQPAPALPSPSTMRSPGKRTRRQVPSRTPSGLSQQVTSSPQPHQALLQQRQPSPGYAHIANGTRPMHSAMSTPQQIASPHDARMTPPNPMYRQASTPGMDTLAGRYLLSLDVVAWKMGEEKRRSCVAEKAGYVAVQTVVLLGSHGDSPISSRSHPRPTVQPRLQHERRYRHIFSVHQQTGRSRSIC